MTIQLYNTLTRKKEVFVPLEEGKVKMYVCGPTVYNYIHIGNARPAIVFDTVRRYFEFRGYDVQYVSNFTDVDDKLIRAANQLGEDVPTIADRFIHAYFEDVTALGCKHADVHPRVMENMDIIIDFISKLIEKGFAYESEGDVYFRTRKFDDYGKLSHQSIDELRVGARIEVGEKKQDDLDFALWKAAKEGEIYWESPWGIGRPGWHIECSAMAKKYLGETIDIHAGGQDLTFPHHENEIAQSEALSGKTFANYWMHNGYINIDNEKMSKSLGNFVLVHDIIKIHNPQVLRFFMLSVHYRNPINYSEELLEIYSKNEFIEIFDANRLSKSPALFDKQKLTWMNNQYMKKVDLDRVVELSLPHLMKAGRLNSGMTDEEHQWVRGLVSLLQEKMSFGAEIVELSDLFFADEAEYEEEAKEILAGEQVPQVLKAFSEEIDQLGSFQAEGIQAAMKAVQKSTGQKGKNLFMPIRAAVTGQTHGPDLPKTIELLGKTKVQNRLQKIIG